MASNLIRNIVITALVAVLIAGFVIAARFYTGTVVPPVDAYLDGERILFIHTEASDLGVAALLTEMKGSPVVVVPSLAKAPKEMLTSVYVFKNGVAGEGPFKFQPDVFDGGPGAKGYSPLRELNLLTWRGGASQRLRLRLRFFSRPGSSGAFANLSLRIFRRITPLRYTAAQSTNGAAAR
jgi:hypothetical protein